LYTSGIKIITIMISNLRFLLYKTDAVVILKSSISNGVAFLSTIKK
jgi:hypothetical protein